MAELPTFTNILVDHDGGPVANIQFNRPKQLNAFSTVMYAELRDALRWFEADDRVEFVVLRGNGRAFAAGGDLKELISYIDSDDPLEIYRFEDSFPFETLRRYPKVLIAVIDGICMAAGMMVMSHCDVVLASERSEFAIPEGRVGLPESFIPALMFGRVPLLQLKYLFLTAKSIDGTEAARIGMVTESMPADDLERRVREVVDEIGATTPRARRLYKEYLSRVVPKADTGDIYEGYRMPVTAELLRTFAGRSKDEG